MNKKTPSQKNISFLDQCTQRVSVFVAEINLKSAIWYHFILAAIVFFPMFMGKNIIGSTDNYYHLFPNLIYNLRCFQNGAFPLWNPYVYAGMDFTASAHNYFYYPINWIIFSFPEKFIYFLMTLRMFCETWAVGIFAFLFFREALQDKKWGLFAATIYQIGGYLFLSITMYAYLTIYMFNVIVLYYLYTLHKRKMWANYVVLSLSLAGIILCCNTVYGISAFISLGVITLYRVVTFIWFQDSRKKQMFIIVASLFTAILLIMIQVFPFASNLIGGSERVDNMDLYTLQGGIYFALSAFVPEVFGVNYESSFPMFKTLLHRADMHSQNHSFNYFGGLSVLLLFWGVLRMRKKESGFWLLFLLFASLWYIQISPVNNVLNILFFPFIHEIVPRMMIPIPFCMLAGLAAKNIEAFPDRFDCRWVRQMVFILTVIVLSILPFYVLGNGFKDIGSVRLVAAGFLLFVIVGYLINRYWNKAIQVVSFFVPIIGFAGSAALLLGVVPLVSGSLSYLGIVYASLTIGAVSALWTVMLVSLNDNGVKQKLLMIFGISFLMAVLFRIIVWGELITFFKEYSFYVLASLGVVRLIFIFAVLTTTVFLYKKEKLSRASLFVIFLVLIIVDLIPHNKVYSHLIQEPFFKGPLYPDRTTIVKDVDVKSYRVNAPNVYLGIREEPLYFSNIHSYYGIRSYGGVNSDQPKRHMQFLNYFYKHQNDKDFGFYLNRLFDILGCRYDSNPEQGRIVRKDALSRFQLFYDFEVLNSDSAVMSRLSAKEFDPFQKLVLEKDPGILMLEEALPSSRIVDYQEKKNSLIELKVRANQKSLLFFGDSYHPDWQALVNGKKKSILRANFKFMAVPLDRGENEIILIFLPKAFIKGKNLSLLGIFFLLVLSGLLFFRRKRNIHDNNKK